MANIFDYAGSLRRMGNDHLLFQEMIVLLQEDAPLYLATIHVSAAAGDYPALRRAAHTLKGLVLNFGAARATSGGGYAGDSGCHRGAQCRGAIKSAGGD